MAIIGTVKAKDLGAHGLDARSALNTLPWRVVERDTGAEYRFKTRQEARAFCAQHAAPRRQLAISKVVE